MHLRDDSYSFNIQRQGDADPQTTADMIFAETLENPQVQLDKILNSTGSLMPELHDFALTPFIGGEYKP